MNNALYPYLGSSAVKSREDLIAQGIIGEDEEVHPYQEIVDSTTEEAQQIEQEKQEEILGIAKESVIIPDGATEYKPPEVTFYSYDENGNEVTAPANPPWAVPVN